MRGKIKYIAIEATRIRPKTEWVSEASGRDGARSMMNTENISMSLLGGWPKIADL